MIPSTYLSGRSRKGDNSKEMTLFGLEHRFRGRRLVTYKGEKVAGEKRIKDARTGIYMPGKIVRCTRSFKNREIGQNRMDAKVSEEDHLSSVRK